MQTPGWLLWLGERRWKRVAGAGVEPASQGYEPGKVPFLQPAARYIRAMTKAERDYLYINHPQYLEGLERGSRSAREWWDCAQGAVRDAIHYGNGPTAEQIRERERFDRENRGAAGW